MGMEARIQGWSTFEMNACHRLIYFPRRIALLALLGLAPSWALGQTQAESLADSFRKAVDRAAPAVVAVRPLDPMNPGLLPSIGPSRPFDAAPLQPFGVGKMDRDASASGVVIDADRGYIVTGDHVLRGSSRAVIVLADGRERLVSQIRRDPGADLAVLIVDPKGLNLTQAAWGDPAALRPGDWVLSIGRPMGGAPSISTGIYSARRLGTSAAGLPEDLLETDAAVNALNSGGPLINLNGEVVGINTDLAGRRPLISGMGFAIPTDRARRIGADLAEFGRFRRAILGVQIEPADGRVPDRPIPPGAVVIGNVTPGTPAAQAGLRPKDVIVSIAGRPVAGVGMLQGLIETAPVGQDLSLTIERAGRRQDVVVRPTAMPAPLGMGSPLAVPRQVPSQRRDALRDGMGGRDPAAPRDTSPPLPSPAREEAPSLLDPIPEPARSGNGPSIDTPKNQPQAQPG
jgi:serine protease Do